MKIIFLFLLLIPFNAAGEIFTAHGYLLELKKVETAKKKRSLGPLYLRAQELCDELSESARDMDEKELQSAALRFKGIDIGSAEAPGAWIKPGFFLALAAKKGKKADLEFFALLGDEQPAGNWDIYTASHTDYSGCDTLGSGVFVKFYGRWRAFNEKYPENYADAAEEALQKLEDILKQTVCVCAGEREALRELQVFLETFPDTPAAEDLQERIDKIKKKTTNIKFECKPS
ncbi:MAG: hypothetical protein HY796_12610 [Elusimicrobia bacterium]|nr:hypothetical protein [Elusimicrobiota bacterium]